MGQRVFRLARGCHRFGQLEPIFSFSFCSLIQDRLTNLHLSLTAHIYSKAFGKSPVVFGAVPSLHAATSICCGLFVARYSKGYRGLVFMVLYCFWMVSFKLNFDRGAALPSHEASRLREIKELTPPSRSAVLGDSIPPPPLRHRPPNRHPLRRHRLPDRRTLPTPSARPGPRPTRTHQRLAASEMVHARW